MRCHLTPVRMAHIKKTETNASRSVEKNDPHTLLVRVETGPASMKNTTKFLKIVKIYQPYDPAILFLDVFLKNMKTLI